MVGPAEVALTWHAYEKGRYIPTGGETAVCGGASPLQLSLRGLAPRGLWQLCPVGG